MKLFGLLLVLLFSVGLRADLKSRYPSIIFPQALVEVVNVCVSDHGATLSTIEPVSYCARWEVTAQEFCNYNGDSQECVQAHQNDTPGTHQIAKPVYSCSQVKTEKLKTPVSYQHTLCDQFSPDSSDQSGICLKWKNVWQTWPYKYTYNAASQDQESFDLFGHVSSFKLPKCK